jgi:triple functional domain protein
MDDSASLDESVENLDRGSVASFGSGNTTDSDKVGRLHHSLNIVGANKIIQNQCWLWHAI